MKPNYIKLDSRNRVTLTKLSNNLCSLYKAYVENDKIILEPVNEIPAQEQWLFEPENKKILKTLKRALKQKGTIDWADIKKSFE